jgi:hypothetical protein
VSEFTVTSDLVDPALADPAWLPWLSQLVGVALSPGMSTAERRAAIASAASGWRAGTKASIAAVVAAQLTGTKQVSIYDHSVNSPGDGTMWDVLIVTRASETPDPDAIPAIVERAGVKPAGVTLHIVTYSTSWDVLEAERPTWADWDGSSWTQIEETGL